MGLRDAIVDFDNALVRQDGVEVPLEMVRIQERVLLLSSSTSIAERVHKRAHERTQGPVQPVRSLYGYHRTVLQGYTPHVPAADKLKSPTGNTSPVPSHNSAAKRRH